MGRLAFPKKLTVPVRRTSRGRRAAVWAATGPSVSDMELCLPSVRRRYFDDIPTVGSDPTAMDRGLHYSNRLLQS